MKTSMITLTLSLLSLLFVVIPAGAQHLRYYLNAGVARPGGTLAGPPHAHLLHWTAAGDDATLQDLLSAGGGTNPGFTVEAGFRIPLRSLSNDLLVDLLAGVEATQLDFDWSGLQREDAQMMFSAEKTPHRFYGLKLGPVLTYRRDADLEFDLYTQLHLVLANKGSWTYSYERTGNRFRKDQIRFQNGFGFQQSLGFQLRLRFIQLGVEADIGRIRFRNVKLAAFRTTPNLEVDPDPLLEKTSSVTFSNNMLKLRIGVLLPPQRLRF